MGVIHITCQEMGKEREGKEEDLPTQLLDLDHKTYSKSSQAVYEFSIMVLLYIYATSLPTLTLVYRH